MMKRTFIAIDIVPDVKLKTEFELIRYRLRLERINWLQDNNLHITLHFIGDTDEDRLPDISRCIQEVISNKTSFELILRSLGVFKNLHDPRVLWIGCDPDSGLERIKNEIDARLSSLAFEPGNREFSPHLTLGRVKEIRQLNQLSQLIALYKGVVFQKVPVNEIILYESRLRFNGPEYIPIQVFPF